MSDKEKVNEKSITYFKESDPLNEDVEKETDKTERNFIETCCYGFKNITVEPTLLLFTLSAILISITSQNLGLEKACRVNLNFTSEICDSLRKQHVGVQNDYERQTQKLVAKFMGYKTYITAPVPCILALLVGSWSDKTGRRKIFLIIPLTGQILACISNIINVYFFNSLSLEVQVFTEAILEGFTGSWCLAIFLSFAYISSVTTEVNRTFRMGMLNFALTVGFPIGMGASGMLLRRGGYYGCYGLAGTLHFINLLYNVFILKDPVRSAEQRQHDNKGFVYFCRKFFDFSNIIESIRVVFKQGPNNRRLRMCVMMIIVSILFGPFFGDISILYLSTRYRFNWDEVQFSVFQVFNFLTHTVGTIFSITVFSKHLQWHDSVLGIISTTSKIAGAMVFCFAPNEKIFYLAPVVEILNGTSMLAMRSLVSKAVAPNELGKVNSIFGLCENLMPLVYVPLYTNVYKATMEMLPGAVFLMGAAMTLPATIAFLWLFYEHRKQVRRLNRAERTLPAEDSLLKPN